MADFAPRSGQLSYPIEDVDKYKSRIYFQAIKVTPPDFSVQFQAGDPASKTAPSGNVQVAKPMQVTRLPGQKVNLYVPIAYNVNDRIDYSNASLGPAGAAVSAGLSSGLGIPGSLMKGLTTAGQSVVDLFDAVGGNAVGGLAATRAAQYIPFEGVRNAIGNVARVTINPNMRTMFTGVQIREFAFQFQFFPKSARESIAVKDIIKFFRFHAYPEEIPLSSPVPIGFKYPNMFRINLSSMVGGKFANIGTPIKMCYLRSVNANYNNQSTALHEDGSPTDITLALSFIEYKTLSRHDIMNEENESFYSVNGRSADDYTPPAFGPNRSGPR